MNAPDEKNAWKRGLELLRPGMYVDANGAIHLDAAEFLAAAGYAHTSENEAMLRSALIDVLKNVEIEDV